MSIQVIMIFSRIGSNFSKCYRSFRKHSNKYKSTVGITDIANIVDFVSVTKHHLGSFKILAESQ
jgi:hypothetical protein